MMLGMVRILLRAVMVHNAPISFLKKSQKVLSLNPRLDCRLTASDTISKAQISIISESDRPCSDIHAKKIWRREDTHTPKTHTALAREDKNLRENATWKNPWHANHSSRIWFVARNGLHYDVLSPSNSWCDIVRSCIGALSSSFHYLVSLNSRQLLNPCSCCQDEGWRYS